MVWQTDVLKHQHPEYFKLPSFFITGLVKGMGLLCNLASSHERKCMLKADSPYLEVRFFRVRFYLIHIHLGFTFKIYSHFMALKSQTLKIERRIPIVF